MTTLEDMRAYIARADDEITWGRYELETAEMLALGEFAGRDLFQALLLAYKYGRAKGARCAMRRAKKGRGF